MQTEDPPPQKKKKKNGVFLPNLKTLFTAGTKLAPEKTKIEKQNLDIKKYNEQKKKLRFILPALYSTD